MKVCTKCNVNKRLDEFNKKTANADGRQNHCKVCASDYAKNYHRKKKAAKKRAVTRAAKKVPLAVTPAPAPSLQLLETKDLGDHLIMIFRK